ncbi:polymorphic toxin type 15 domain-containing protein [Tsukamurella paurometabola]|uniref:polymorphic toxin type 15 domain-containing protein n=1 Tax=Tsukamurella paurometabola TaxID=2061 RepID=UPI000A30BE68|nr:polymorphic toxin type 15 domain-containing protein [Tsukamurella paurometabola]
MFVPSASSPLDYQFPVDVGVGQKLVARSDGSVDVVDLSGAVVQTIGVPWAVDAQGRQHSTWYTIDENSPGTLTQHIRPDVDARYPLLADPSSLPGHPEPLPEAPPAGPLQPSPQPSSGGSTGGGWSGTGSGSGSGAGSSGSSGSSRGSGSGGSGNGGGGAAPPDDGTSTDPGFSRDYDLSHNPGGASTPGFGGAKIDNGSGPRQAPGSYDWDVPKFDYSVPAPAKGEYAFSLFGLFSINPFSGNTSVLGIKFNLWDTVGNIAGGVGKAIDGVGKAIDGIVSPKPKDDGKPAIPGTTPQPFAQVVVGAAAFILLFGAIYFATLPPQQRQDLIRRGTEPLNQWWNNARDRIHDLLNPAEPEAKTPTIGGEVKPPAQGATEPPHTTPNPVPSNPVSPVTPDLPAAPFTTPGGNGTGAGTVGTPTRPGTQIPAVPAGNPGISTPAPGGGQDDPNNDDDDGPDKNPDKDTDHQSYPAGGIIGAGLGGASIETPGLPTTPGTNPPEPNNGTPGTTTPLDPDHHLDPNKPDKATPVEIKPEPTAPKNPILGLAENILGFFFPKPKPAIPEPSTPEHPGGTTTGTGTNNNSSKGDGGDSGDGGGDSAANSGNTGATTPSTPATSNGEGPGSNGSSSTHEPPASTPTAGYPVDTLAKLATSEVYGPELEAVVAALQKEATGPTVSDVQAAQKRLIEQGNQAPAVDAMVNIVASMLAARDKQELAAAQQHLEDIAAKLGVPVANLPKTDDMYLFPMSAAPTNPTHSPYERIRELLTQITWHNSQTVQEAYDQAKNRTYSSAEAEQARKDFRDQLRTSGYEALLEMGYRPDAADSLSKSIAEQLMKKLVVTHNPDRIVGGRSDKMVTFGDSRTNSSIGNANQRGAAAYLAWLEVQMKKNPDAIVRFDFVEPDDPETPSTTPPGGTDD